MTAVAMTEVAARVFPAGALRDYLKSHPDALAAVALSLLERLEETESRILNTGRDYSANQRLARLLCDLESHGYPHSTPAGQVTGTVIPVRLSQAEFASWIGASRETVERTLRSWRARHIVSTMRRTIIVHDLETLAHIAGVKLRRRAWNWPAMPGTGAEWYADRHDFPLSELPIGYRRQAGPRSA
jgi:CRP-like cAMP-binding protein